MGINVSQTSTIPTSTSTNIRFYSGKIDTFNQGTFNGLVNITGPSHRFDFGYAWAGDLDFSHSTPKTITSIANRSNRIETTDKQANTTITTKLVDTKVVVEIKLEETNLAGAQYKIKYDVNKLELEEVVFDAGRDVTNFSTPRDNAIVFGSIDNIGTAKIKPGMPYKLIFKTKSTISNTTGLVFIEFAEAVAQNGDKIILNVK
jgi:Ca2+-binding RTX toxin-like protein